ncbi:hypothetical protein FIV42_07815 [Persicimonas caeni]|uniref:Uncharacterized protein n=1 Tax=Persicimonas caeni TaxID=2292766 RepID=A0A4Y6PQW6_PERCE|nr:hypothetical protein [Persicimonas caeni]QDG50640.1 hypothetical protein FIV42_07815 [Persicimonas caeni]QED31861.1 hypothetical protein FRD00_07810 [Persicimonas caeni]
MTHRMMTIVAISFTTLTLLLAGCGEWSQDDNNSEGASTCEVPAGEYAVRNTGQSGDCSEETLEEVLDGITDMTIEEGEACGPLETTTQRDLSDGCVATYTTTAQATAAGLEDASVTIDVSCASGPLCSHDFELDYQEQPDEPTCIANFDCAADERCNMDTGECGFACESDAECVDSETCDLDVGENGGVCVADDA